MPNNACLPWALRLQQGRCYSKKRQASAERSPTCPRPTTEGSLPRCEAGMGRASRTASPPRRKGRHSRTLTRTRGRRRLPPSRSRNEPHSHPRGQHSHPQQIRARALAASLPLSGRTLPLIRHTPLPLSAVTPRMLPQGTYRKEEGPTTSSTKFLVVGRRSCAQSPGGAERSTT